MMLNLVSTLHILVLIFLALFSNVHAQTLWTSGRADGHAPISVMGDHTHSQGEWMFSYRYMYMGMEGMRQGNQPLEAAQVNNPELENYLISPTRMPMGMHMLGGMYALTNNLTLMAMLGYTHASMDHVTRAGGVSLQNLKA